MRVRFEELRIPDGGRWRLGEFVRSARPSYEVPPRSGDCYLPLASLSTGIACPCSLLRTECGKEISEILSHVRNCCWS
jgi:hypothetical protein